MSSFVYLVKGMHAVIIKKTVTPGTSLHDSIAVGLYTSCVSPWTTNYSAAI